MIGTKVGNYEITAEIGKGGMGSVYLAQHPLIGVKAAVKVLRSELADIPDLTGRFYNEAKAAALLRHPHIVQVMDFGQLDDGSPYIVMEHLEGETVSGRMRRLGRLPIEAAADIAWQVAEGVGFAHKQGVIHRDLKPDNIFLLPDPDREGQCYVKVLDFGIAKLSQSDAGAVQTQTGAVLGTPTYMSPEQCLGASTIDLRSDVYSLGLCFYAMVCGRPPFVSQAVGRLLLMHMNEVPPDPRTFVASIPAPLAEAMLKALAKEPNERIASMPAFQSVIEPLLAGPRPTKRGTSGALTPVPEIVLAAREEKRAEPPREASLFAPTAGGTHEVLRSAVVSNRRWTIAGAALLAAGAASLIAFYAMRPNVLPVEVVRVAPPHAPPTAHGADPAAPTPPAGVPEAPPAAASEIPTVRTEPPNETTAAPEPARKPRKKKPTPNKTEKPTGAEADKPKRPAFVAPDPGD